MISRWMLEVGTLTRIYDVAGLTLLIQMIPNNSDNQAIIGIFGNRPSARADSEVADISSQSMGGSTNAR